MNKNNFLSFKKCREVARSLCFSSSFEWKEYCRENIFVNLPICPNAVYKIKWKGWRDFLGTEILLFQDARDIARSAKLNQKRDWIGYVRSHKNVKLPTNPNLYYKNKGWIDWYDFLDKSSDKRRYGVNDNYFKTWSRDMAYILGLWWADGWISDRNSLFSITLHKKDSYLLYEILNKMNSTYPVKKYNNYGVINIRSKNIVDDVKKLGGMERKSLIIGFPVVPVEVLPDFIRGLWDGDGCVHVNNKTKRYGASIASGSLNFICKLQTVIQKNIKGATGCMVKLKNTNCYSLMLSKNDAIKLREFLYKNDAELKLVRKYDKFKEIGEIIFLRKKDMLSFKEAKEIVKNYGIKNSFYWQKFWKKNNRPLNLPSGPSGFYRNQGWISWSNFLGNDDLED